LGTPDLGLEAADEAMLRAFARWDTVRSYGNPAGWCYRVGLNWARNQLRRQRRGCPGIYETASGTDDPLPDSELDEALGSLSLRHRTVVVLRYYLGWTVPQIADALRLPAGTVKSRLHRALRKLERQLGDGR
jgi:RNA polymerase sigma-70 factor (ECF subfamily)